MRTQQKALAEEIEDEINTRLSGKDYSARAAASSST